jgi:hypothetical protein
MAQVGDTITYTHDGDTDGNDDLKPEQEDVSTVDEVVVDYCDGAGGKPSDGGTAGGSGGRVEGVVADVSSYDTIYIWVAGFNIDGRYDGGVGTTNFDTLNVSGSSGGSTEVSVLNTNQADSSDEPFIAAAGGGGGGAEGSEPGGGGARDAAGAQEGEGVAPPLGGVATANSPGGDGEGAVDDGTSVPITDNGTTIKGGGAGNQTNAEVQLSFQSSGGGLSPPDPPSNLTAEQQ